MDRCKHEHTFDYEKTDHGSPSAPVIIQERCIDCDSIVSQREKREPNVPESEAQAQPTPNSREDS